MPAMAVFDPLDKYYGDTDRGEFQDYDDSQDKPWQESRIGTLQLPPDAALLTAKIDRMPPGLALFIDPASLHLDENDGVLRFWAVIKSRAGAYNATYEGLRCETREYKVYAYGNPRREPKVRAAPKPVWKSYRGYGQLNYRDELAKTLMCTANSARPVSDIVATLRGQMDYIQPSDSINLGH